MSLVGVQAASWNQLLTRNFAVVPELLGRSHTFPFDQKTIIVELPTTAGISHDPNRRGRVEILVHKEDNGRRVPTCFAVNSIEILVRIPNQVEVPEQILNQPPNAYDDLSKDQQDQLEELATTHRSIAEKAFDLWVRSLRWKSNNGSIGRPEVLGARSGWTTYLLDEATRHRFWAATQVFEARSCLGVTLEEWNEVERALSSGVEPPVFYDLMFDAEEHFRLGDLERSVVDAAVASETFMRGRVLQLLPANLNDKVKQYVDEANVRQVLNHLFPETLSDRNVELFKAIKSTVHELFSVRNAILHSGRKSSLKPVDCKKCLEASKKLIALE